jgi:hypothetical protein
MPWWSDNPAAAVERPDYYKRLAAHRMSLAGDKRAVTIEIIN